MFKLSAKGIYGLSAVLELGLNLSKGPMQIREIAAAQGIPQHYLEQLLVSLRKAGLVKSYRGAQGGYALARPPGQTRVYEILSCLEGELEIAGEAYRDGSLGFYWTKIEAELRRILDITLEELILEKQHADRQFTYSI